MDRNNCKSSQSKYSCNVKKDVIHRKHLAAVKHTTSQMIAVQTGVSELRHNLVYKSALTKNSYTYICITIPRDFRIKRKMFV